VGQINASGKSLKDFAVFLPQFIYILQVIKMKSKCTPDGPWKVDDDDDGDDDDDDDDNGPWKYIL
jgi:hypothetical protein